MAIRVLMVASEYVQPDFPLGGIFFRDQALAANGPDVQVHVCFVELRSLRRLSPAALRESHFQITVQEESGILTMRQKGWNPVTRTIPGARLWVQLMARLVNRYVAQFGRPDLLHAHNALWAGYAAHEAATEHRLPYIITEHSSLILQRRVPPGAINYAEKAYAGADRVLAVSHSLAEAVRHYGRQRSVEVVPNLLDTEFFGLPSVEPEPCPFRFLAVGGLNRNKGFHVLLQAFAEVFRGNSTVQLDFVGDGPERKDLQKQSETLGLAAQVRFFGELTREGVREAMWRSHALVLTSFYETFGVVLIEALATGIPVIATRSGGPQDLVTPEVGQLVRPGSIQDLCQALADVKGKTWFRTQLRDYVLGRYSREAVVARLRSIYGEVVRRSDATFPGLQRDTVPV